MSCIGTAGHVDHGKSTLVKALTGIDPDRLVEEKSRGMTIDLGFAWLKLSNGQEVSIVDVPGHENFIKNMLAGVGGIDAALLTIAADEGVMPQTREHLAILDLLHVERGIVALTKMDLVDEEWLELVCEEVRAVLQPTRLAQAPILPVSAYTGQGLPELRHTLEQLLQEGSERQNIARPRLPIDRVFTLTGHGTIVTGTLLDGNLAVGQEVEIMPQGIRSRVRSLQTHKQQVEVAMPGTRVAINLPNVARHELARGNVVGLPGQLRPTQLCDARLTLLLDAPCPLLHNAYVDFYSGTQEIAAKVRLLDTNELLPGKQAWVQLRLSRPAVVARRDHFILRVPSLGITIGGGEIIDTLPHYHRRFQPGLLTQLSRQEQGTPEELVLTALDRREGTRTTGGGLDISQIARQCNLAIDVTRQTLETLLTERRVRVIGDYWFACHVWKRLVDEAVRLVSDYHRRYPLRSGLSKEEWRTRLQLTPRVANEVFQTLQSERVLDVVPSLSTLGIREQPQTRSGSIIRLPLFSPVFSPVQHQQVQKLLSHYRAHAFAPPTRAEAEALADTEIVAALVEQQQLVKVGEQLLFLRETYLEAIHLLVAHIRKHGSITVAGARDLLGTSRKYILPLLEELDALRILKRQGDERVLGPNGLNVLSSQDEK